MVFGGSPAWMAVFHQNWLKSNSCSRPQMWPAKLIIVQAIGKKSSSLIPAASAYSSIGWMKPLAAQETTG